MWVGVWVYVTYVKLYSTLVLLPLRNYVCASIHACRWWWYWWWYYGFIGFRNLTGNLFLHPSLPLQLQLTSPYDKKTFNGNNLLGIVRSQHRTGAQIRMDGWMDVWMGT